MSTNRHQGPGPNRVRCIVTPASAARGKRVREPTKNFSGLFRGKFPSRKTGRMVHWESLLERDAILLYEFSPGIATFREQPYSISYFHAGRMRRYTPDFELTFRSGRTELVEVKPWIKLQKTDEQQRFEAIGSYLNARGQRFRLLSDLEIRKRPLLDNLRLLYRYRTPQLLNDESHRLVEMLKQVRTPVFEELVRTLGSEKAFWQLVELGKIVVDLTEQVSKTTRYTLNLEGDDDETIYF
jgi:hypothetical protein